MGCVRKRLVFYSRATLPKTIISALKLSLKTDEYGNENKAELNMASGVAGKLRSW